MEDIILNIAQEQLCNRKCMDIVFENYKWFFDELFNTFMKNSTSKLELILATNKLNIKETLDKIDTIEKKINHIYNYIDRYKLDYVGEKFKASLKNKTFDINLYSQLFYVKNLETLSSCRLGYYYGVKIIENLSYDYDLLKVPYNKYSSKIFEYFSIKNK